MTSSRPRAERPARAVVIGASIAGLIAARVLSERVDEVVIVERDQLGDDAATRPGVPQAPHVHVLLRRGYRELTRLYPSFDQRLASAGAPALDLLRDSVWILPSGQSPRVPSRLLTRSATRPLYEAVIRELTLDRSNVRLLDGHDAVGLLGHAAEVTGVRLRRRPVRAAPATATATATEPSPHGGTDREPEGATSDLDAWLVVDASGRASRAPEYLAAIGAPVPTESVIDASLRYATRHYRVPPGPRDWTTLLIRDRPPSSTRGGGVFQVEGGRWVVTLGGAGRDHPPTDEDGFLEFARGLISPRLFDAIRDAEPISPIRGWARMANRWRHAERIRRWPAGFALMGDALCALNPVYGQGMSVAAMEGGVLGDWLDSGRVQRGLRSSRPPDTGRLVRDFARTARLPWFLATGEDARIDGVTGVPKASPFEALGRRYVDEVLLDAVRDPGTLRRFTEVSNLVRPPIALLDPMVLSRVVASVVRRSR